jgi:dCMP deaminase
MTRGDGFGFVSCSLNEGIKTMTEKRSGYISWDDYFMGIAVLSAHRSKDPSSQVGACIVNPGNKIVGIGYNGFPTGCGDETLPWAREGESSLDTKYPYVCHAELNAITNKNQADIAGCRIYSTLFPCNECTKLIIQSGIREVIFLSDKYHDTESCEAARKMMDLSGVGYRPFTPETQDLTINFQQETESVQRS